MQFIRSSTRADDSETKKVRNLFINPRQFKRTKVNFNAARTLTQKQPKILASLFRRL